MTRDEALEKAASILKQAEKEVSFRPERAEAGAKIAHSYIELAKELRLGA